MVKCEKPYVPFKNTLTQNSCFGQPTTKNCLCKVRAVWNVCGSENAQLLFFTAANNFHSTGLFKCQCLCLFFCSSLIPTQPMP